MMPNKAGIVSINKDGIVHALIRTAIESSCRVTADYYPFDVHTCDIGIGTLSNEIDFFLDAHNIRDTQDVSCMTSPPDFRIIESVSTREGHKIRDKFQGNTTYSRIIHKVVIARTDASFEHLIRPMLILITISTLIVYWMPPKSFSMRLFLIFFTVAASFALILVSGNEVGYTRASRLQCFLCTVIMMNLASIIVSQAIFLSASKVYTSALNMRLASCVNGLAGKVLLLEFTAISYDLKTEMEKKVEGSGPLCIVLQEEWVLLAALMDRIVFFIYLCILCVLFPSFT